MNNERSDWFTDEPNPSENDGDSLAREYPPGAFAHYAEYVKARRERRNVTEIPASIDLPPNRPEINFKYQPLDPNAFYQNFWEDNVQALLEFELSLLGSVRNIQTPPIHERGMHYYFAHKQGIALAPTNIEPQRFHLGADLYLFPQSNQVQLIIGGAVRGISIVAGYKKENDVPKFFATVRNSAVEDLSSTPLEIDKPEVLCTELSGPFIAPAGTPAFWIHAAVRSNLIPIVR